ncbi:MAG TPA: BON domain-containing protein [Solimonas sp.]|nr:BON domain-containing protein [Solimonas sp.]
MKLKPLAIAALLPIAALAAGEYGGTPADKPTTMERMESGTKAAVDATKRETSDAWITSKVKSAIAVEKDLSSFDVNIETEKGVVQLFGFVETQAQIDHAGKVAASIAGVKSVKNDLKIDSTQSAKSAMKTEAGDAAITTKVKAALVREKDLSAMDINVETENGVVQLAGFVDRKEQIDRASKVVSRVKGVKSVKNDLHLKSGS